MSENCDPESGTRCVNIIARSNQAQTVIAPGTEQLEANVTIRSRSRPDETPPICQVEDMWGN